MLPLNQTAGYAILALGMMEGPDGRPRLVREIAEATGIPKPYLSKMIHQLAARGIVETKRGYRGGVVLSRPPDRIALSEVAEAVEGKPLQARCLLGLAECTDERACPLHQFWKKTLTGVHKRLQGTTLAEAAKFECEQRAHHRLRPAAKRATPITKSR